METLALTAVVVSSPSWLSVKACGVAWNHVEVPNGCRVGRSCEVLRIAASVVDEVHILGNLRWWQFWLEGQGATCWWERMSREVGSQGGEETAAGRGELEVFY